jgi:hypothetical protein
MQRERKTESTTGEKHPMFMRLQVDIYRSLLNEAAQESIKRGVSVSVQDIVLEAIVKRLDARKE